MTARQTLLHAMTEAQFQAAVIELAERNGWTVYHVPDSRRTTARGVPDLLLWRSEPTPRVLWRELKTERGRLSKEQKHVINLFNAAGHNTQVWRPSDWQEIERTLCQA